MLLPILTFDFYFRGRSLKVPCLLDLGSQRSYLTPQVLSKLGMDALPMREYPCEVKTFLGAQERLVKETALTIDTGNRKLIFPFLVDSNLNLEFEVRGLRLALHNIRYKGYKLADSFLNDLNSDHIVGIQGLIGIDVLQFILPFSFMKCMHGTAINLTQGIVPFGNIFHFIF